MCPCHSFFNLLRLRGPLLRTPLCLLHPVRLRHIFLLQNVCHLRQSLLTHLRLCPLHRRRALLRYPVRLRQWILQRPRSLWSTRGMRWHLHRLGSLHCPPHMHLPPLRLRADLLRPCLRRLWRGIAPPSATNLRARKWGLCCSAKRWRSMVFGIGIIQLCRTGSSYPTRRHPLGFIISQLCRRRTKILSSKMVSLLPLEWPPSSTNWILTQAFPVWTSRLGDRTVSLTSVSTQAVLAPTMLSPSTIPLAWQLTLAEITLRSDEGRLSLAMGHDTVLCGCATSCDNAVLCGCATSCDTAIDTPFWVLRVRAQLPILTCLPRTLSWRLVACEEKKSLCVECCPHCLGSLAGIIVEAYKKPPPSPQHPHKQQKQKPQLRIKPIQAKHQSKEKGKLIQSWSFWLEQWSRGSSWMLCWKMAQWSHCQLCYAKNILFSFNQTTLVLVYFSML